MMRALIIPAATLALTTAPVLASGPVEAEAPAPLTFTTPSSGYDWTGPSLGVQLGYGDVDTSGPSLEGDGALYGLRAYYDYDLGDYIVGGGVQYDATDIDLGGVTTLESVTRVGLRAGFDLGQNWVYGTGGYARATTSGGGVGDSDGYFVGAGYETFLTDTLTLGAEVLYHQFDSFDLGGLEVDATTASVGLNFRF